jgi:hypothetical protein
MARDKWPSMENLYLPEEHGVTEPPVPLPPEGFRPYVPTAIGPNGERIQWSGKQWVPIA